MPRYLVRLTAVHPNDDSKDIHTSHLVEASVEDEAISIAKSLAVKEHIELKRTDFWSWSSYITAQSKNDGTS